MLPWRSYLRAVEGAIDKDSFFFPSLFSTTYVQLNEYLSIKGATKKLKGD